MDEIARRPPRAAGRPPRRRPLHRFGVFLNVDLYDRLVEWCDQVELVPGAYLNQLVATAFGWESRYLWPLEPAELVADPLQLRLFAQSLSRADFLPAGPQDLRGRIDVALAEQVLAHCRENGFSLAEYVRALLGFSLGVTREGQEQQLDLGVGPRPGGVRARAS